MAATTVAKLNIHLGATTGLGPVFSQATAELNQLGEHFESWQSRLSKLLIAGGAGGFLGWGVKLAAEAQTAEVGFRVMLGSAAAAQKTMAELTQFAAQTPFEFPELREAARMLIAFGVESDRLIPTLTTIGDISSGLGIPLRELAELFGKAKVQGRLAMEDINQMTGRGIPVIQELAKQFGVAESEVRNLVSTGQIHFQHLERAFQSLAGEGGKFAGMMAQQSATLAGQWSTLQDNASQLATSVGTLLVPVLSDLLTVGNRMLEQLTGLDEVTQQNVVRIGLFAAGMTGAVMVIPRLVAAIRSVVAAYRALVSAQAIAQAFQGPKGWATLAASAGIAAAAVWAISASFDEAEEKATGAGRAAEQAAQGIDQVSASAQEVTRDFTEATRSFDEFVARGRQITEQLRTPVEQFEDTMGELIMLINHGAISWETYSRGVLKARDDLREALEAKEAFDNAGRGVAAVTRFSSAGFSAVQDGQDALRRLHELQAKQLAEQQAQTEVLRAIEEDLRQRGIQIHRVPIH